MEMGIPAYKVKLIYFKTFYVMAEKTEFLWFYIMYIFLYITFVTIGIYKRMAGIILRLECCFLG